MGERSGPSREKVGVLIADATRMGCELLSDALKRSRYPFHIIDTVTTSEDVRRVLKAQEPHVLLISANLLDGALKGLEVLREVHASRSKTHTVVLVDANEDALVISAFREGARGVFSRGESVKELPRCIHQVHSGQIWASNNNLQLILETLAQSAPPRLVDAQGMKLLTKREEEVASLVAEGLSNREISQKLALSEHTVKNYLFRIFEKLGLSNRVELILYVLDRREGARPAKN
jgi:DNA-binding NarL/FixJ family response regulator